MVKQERALRTRSALLDAAAEVFDEHGYDGASFAQICKRIGISMGALTYHFSTKDDLVDTIRARGQSATRSTVHQVVSRRLPPLQAAVELTLAITELLATDAAVRAAARLSRERPAAEPAWLSLWADPLSDMLHTAGALRSGTDPKTVASLAIHLVTGAEVDIRHARHRRGTQQAPPTAQQLAQIWQLVLSSMAADTT